MSRMAEPLIGLMRWITGRPGKRKREWLNEEDPAGTFVQKMTPNGWRMRSVKKMTIEIKPWAEYEHTHPALVCAPVRRSCALKLVYWLEEVFPGFFAKHGQYPLIVVKKQ